MMSKLNSQVGRSHKRRRLSPEPEVERLKTTGTKSNTIKPNRHEQATMENSKSATLPSVKDLASSEASIRRAALKNMLNHLTQRSASSNLSTTECLQIWKGFFVAIYMHDSKNAISVQNLIREIASTFQIFNTKDLELQQSDSKVKTDDGAVPGNWLEQYHAAFWQILVKEWAGIDSHRMNKYLLLVRFVVKELAFICLRPLFESQKASDNSVPNDKTRKRKVKTETSKEIDEAISEQNQIRIKSITKILQNDGPLNTTDRKIPDGLRLHILDLYVAEIFAAFSSLAEATETSEGANTRDSAAIQVIMTALKSPLRVMASSESGAPKNVRTKAKETLVEFEVKEDEIQISS